MQKRIIGSNARDLSSAAQVWLDLRSLAQVEVTSEDGDHPIESALVPGAGAGWRAGQSGEQTIRLLFNEPVRLSRIHLEFNEDEQDRTQEFVLRWSPDGGGSYREILRQQYNFSAGGTTREVEDYDLDLNGVTALELRIVPDIRASNVLASLAQLRLVGSKPTGDRS